MFRKALEFLLILCLLLAPAASLAQTIPCYTGPGYEYDTLDFTMSEGMSITCYYMAYDSKGSPWVQAEVSQGTNLLRIYLPKDNIAGSITALTVEKRPETLIPSMLAHVYQTDAAVPRLGPGTHFNKLNYTITSQTEGVIILFENGWGLLEVESNGRTVRFWLPEHTLQY